MSCEREESAGGEWDGEGVVGEGPEEVLLDGSDGEAGECDGVGDEAEVGPHEGDAGGLHGDVGACGESDAEMSAGE